ncbi:dihydroxyacetone kinase family protein [Lapillicoccus sp.]|uniref:dihydroxyacetone kinase family protein n=1 Tax=Lapillicoccus sp. TaxID=1909287 RepID=UPI0025EA0634|nr:dihydroxyacetone kinase family protein [Lapillicoccus sp.]
MSYLVNDPDTFIEEMIDGFVAVHGEIVQRVDGGVCRAAPTPRGQVALVIGGGSGHYPAFAGLVGPGLAHGAAMGHVFASPSAHQVYEVARAAASDSGVLLSYGNYAGDVLNFDAAQERLRAEGIPTRTVVVTDDISSAGPDQRGLRRGVAGDLPVFRAAAWAAEEGRSLDETWEVAHRANERTRTLGVAFSGCTLPGAEAPLFTVPAGRMAVGLGIHGEPGIEEQDIPTARELANELVDRLLDEAPGVSGAGGDRVAVILNGLGSIKSEELFVVYGQVAKRLDAAGLIVVQPEVGEFATSFEMAGLSLTLMWLDDELERAWTSPAATAAYRRGAVTPPADSTDGHPPRSTPAPSLPPSTPRASADSQSAAAGLADCVRAIRGTVTENVDRLGRLDAVAGDGDHGIGMQRGVTAAAAAADAAVDAGAGARTTLLAAADAWAEHAGGTSGALWGLGLRAMAERFSDDLPASATGIVGGVADARDAVMRVGKARLGDKTLLDSLIPFSERLAADVRDGTPLSTAWVTAAEVATTAAEATAELLPLTGRARAHTQRSVGSPDPGAVSFALAVTAIGALVAGKKASA